ncbi:hypothetical protein ACKI10_18450 [Streptomyces galilaeus]|uniref:Uncharacterized protein n=1 Tax=Streptomyces galilaeus TaxID=33899 RepID=A0ABW9IDM3_STRGJ
MSQGTGVTAVDAAVVWSVAAATIAGAALLAWRAVRGLRKLFGRLVDMADDWHGVPERPGVPGRQGVMVRLLKIEERVARVDHELQPNSGGSLRDAVDRVDRRTQTLAPDPGTDE